MKEYAVIVIDHPGREEDVERIFGYIEGILSVEVIEDVVTMHPVKDPKDVRSLLSDERARESIESVIREEIGKYRELGAEGGPQYILVKATINDKEKFKKAIDGLEQKYDIGVHHEIFERERLV